MSMASIRPHWTLAVLIWAAASGCGGATPAPIANGAGLVPAPIATTGEDPGGAQRKTPVQPEAARYRRPKDARWNDREVRIDVQGGLLAGTLSEPRLRANLDRPKAPGVIWLSAPGARDRHGLSGAIDFGTWEIFDRLADEGFAVLRIDDRGVGGSRSIAPAADAGRALALALEDAKACLGFMRVQAAVDRERIFVLGHDEGGVTAATLAAEEAVAGLALIATPYRRQDLSAALMKIEARTGVAVFQGMKDLEVSWREDAKPIVEVLKKHGHKQAKLFAYEDVDHLMKSEPGVSSVRRYADRSRRIEARFLDDLVRWLRSETGR